MVAMVWMTLGFSAVSGLMLISDWVRVHRPSLFFNDRRRARFTAGAPAWSREDVRFVRAAERVAQEAS